MDISFLNISQNFNSKKNYTQKSKNALNKSINNTTLPKNSPAELLGRSQVSFKGFKIENSFATTENKSTFGKLEEKSSYDMETGNYSYRSKDKNGLVEYFHLDRTTNTKTHKTRTKEGNILEEIDVNGRITKYLTTDKFGKPVEGFVELQDGNVERYITDFETLKHTYILETESGKTIKKVITEPEKNRQITEAYDNRGQKQTEIVDLRTKRRIYGGPLAYDIQGKRADGKIEKINLLTGQVVYSEKYNEGLLQKYIEYSEKTGNALRSIEVNRSNGLSYTEKVYDEYAGYLKKSITAEGHGGKYNTTKKEYTFNENLSALMIEYTSKGREKSKQQVFFAKNNGDEYISKIHKFVENTNHLKEINMFYENGNIREEWFYNNTTHEVNTIYYYDIQGNRIDVKHFNRASEGKKKAQASGQKDGKSQERRIKEVISKLEEKAGKNNSTAYSENEMKNVNALFNALLAEAYEEGKLDENSSDKKKYRVLCRMTHPDTTPHKEDLQLMNQLFKIVQHWWTYNANQKSA